MPDHPPIDDVPPIGDKGKEGDGDDDRKEYRAGNCNDCNRQFCLDYNLPICKGAGMEDVFTTCFREFAYRVLRDWDSRDGVRNGWMRGDRGVVGVDVADMSGRCRAGLEEG